VKTDQYGQITISDLEAVEALYKGITIDQILLENAELVNQFNKSIDVNKDKIDYLNQYITPNVDKDTFDKQNQKQWFMPVDYCPNLYEGLYDMCETPEQVERVNHELELFHKHGMTELLYYLKYLVDTMRSNNIVWGVGRGSSVSSYVLYLLGVHKIDSIKYKLDIREFLK